MKNDGNSVKLRTQFFLYTSVVIFILAASLITHFSNQFKKHAILRLIESGNIVSSHIAFNSLDFLFNEMYPSLTELINDYSNFPDIKSLTILNRQMRIVADLDKTRIGQHIDLSSNKEGYTKTKKEIQFIKPVESYGQQLGFVILSLSTQRMADELKSIIISWFVSGIIIFALICFLAYLLAGRITSPLKDILNVTKAISKGDFSQKSQARGFDELESIVSAMNSMTDAIQEREEKNQEINMQITQLSEYLSSIINSLDAAIIGLDSKGRIIHLNNKVELLTGFSIRDSKGSKLWEVLPENIISADTIKNVIAKNEFKKISNISIISNEDPKYYDIRLFPLVSQETSGAVVLVEDITQQKRYQETMIQTEKMLSVGGLAAGMAHEINNPLAGIMQTANVMENRLNTHFDMPANEKAAQKAGTTMEAIKDFMEARGIPRMAKSIRGSGERLAKIVENMLSFARKSDAGTSSHFLPDLMDKILNLASTDYDLKKQYDFRDIKVIKQYEDNLPDVPCEGSKIQQVCLNIFRNGAQAMQEAKTELPQFIVGISFIKQQNKICIEIEDNGPGMSEDISKRIFEPFFTTKPVGIGTGLGLSVSYFIITENHGGEMMVESEPGKGTKFVIILPV